MDSINVYYQSDLHGKEIADSLGRYLHYCLGGDVIKTELSMNSEIIINNPKDIHYLFFTNLYDSVKLWVAIIDKVSKEIEYKERKLKIINLTYQKDFPIIADPSEVIISSNSCKDWLSKIIIEKPKKIIIKFAETYHNEIKANINH